MPKQSFNAGGYRLTHRYRIRPMVLGSVLEEQQEHSDGSVRWRRAQFPVPVFPHNPNMAFAHDANPVAYRPRRLSNGWFGLVLEELEPEGEWIRVKEPVEMGHIWIGREEESDASR